MLVSGIIFCTSSCEKDTRDYELTVIVTVYDSVKVQNALVHVFADTQGSFVDYYNYTSEEGETHYKFDNKVIVEIEAGKSGFKACGFAEVDRGENVIRIDLKPYTDPHNGC